MEPLVILAAVIFLAWLALDHFRKQQILRDSLDLQKQALEKGVPPPPLEPILAGMRSRSLSLRLAIISLCLGTTLAVMSFLVEPIERDVILLFRLIGVLVIAFGVANFLSWLAIDRRR